jgi:hypothetical protein
VFNAAAGEIASYVEKKHRRDLPRAFCGVELLGK